MASRSPRTTTCGDRRRALADDRGRRRLRRAAWIDEGRAREVLPDVYARSTAQRPGVLRRDAVWWQERRFLESPFARRGASMRRHVIATRDGTAVGYVQYRQRTDNVSLAAGRARPDHRAPRHRYARGRDAVALRVRDRSAPDGVLADTPVDHPLHLLVDNPRQLTRKRADSLWLRVDNIPRALAARTSGGELGSASATTSTTCRAARRRRANRRSRSRPGALPRVLIGGLRPSELASAGLASGDVLAADRVFASTPAPWCPEIFGPLRQRRDASMSR